MKNLFPVRWFELSASLVMACTLAGCQRKADANAELNRAVTTMQRTEAAPAASRPQLSPAAPTPAREMNQAVAAYKAGQFEDAVTRLQRLRAMTTLTPQQRIALNDAMAAVMTEISTLAAKGDPRAVQALAQYGKMQNQRQ